MRKTLVFFLVLALVCGCGAVLAAQAVTAPRADVSFREEIVSGDPAAAAGLEADYDVRMKDHLIWDSTLRFSGENYTYDTAFRYAPRGEGTDPQPTYRGVMIDLIRDAWITGGGMDVNPYGYSAAFRQLLADPVLIVPGQGQSAGLVADGGGHPGQAYEPGQLGRIGHHTHDHHFPRPCQGAGGDLRAVLVADRQAV